MAITAKSAAAQTWVQSRGTREGAPRRRRPERARLPLARDAGSVERAQEDDRGIERATRRNAGGQRAELLGDDRCTLEPGRGYSGIPLVNGCALCYIKDTSKSEPAAQYEARS